MTPAPRTPPATHPGLDPALVRAALPSTQRRFDDALHATDQHLSAHGGYVSWSGGRDSTVVVDLARRTHPDIPVVWFDSGLEFPDTEPYIQELADTWSLNLHIIRATPTALDLLTQSGAWDDSKEPDWSTPNLHETLVTIPAQKARSLFGAAETWGLRAAESQARRALLAPTQGLIHRADGTLTYAPIWAWRTPDLDAYLAHHDIPLNPAYQRLTAAGATGKDLRVGLAVDGNNLHHGRLTWLKRAYPTYFTDLTAPLPRMRKFT